MGVSRKHLFPDFFQWHFPSLNSKSNFFHFFFHVAEMKMNYNTIIVGLITLVTSEGWPLGLAN